MSIAFGLATLFAGACVHLAPASTVGVPPPWPAPDSPVVFKGEPPPIAVEPKAKPLVPPLKRTDKTP
jgi:hypothetical protein